MKVLAFISRWGFLKTMHNLHENLISILYAEDNAQDSELALRSLKKHNLTNQFKLVRDGEEAL